MRLEIIKNKGEGSN